MFVLPSCITLYVPEMRYFQDFGSECACLRVQQSLEENIRSSNVHVDISNWPQVHELRQTLVMALVKRNGYS